MQLDKIDTLFDDATMKEVVARTEAAQPAGLTFGDVIRMDAVQPDPRLGKMTDDPFGASEFLDEI